MLRNNPVTFQIISNNLNIVNYNLRKFQFKVIIQYWFRLIYSMTYYVLRIFLFCFYFVSFLAGISLFRLFLYAEEKEFICFLFWLYFAVWLFRTIFWQTALERRREVACSVWKADFFFLLGTAERQRERRDACFLLHPETKKRTKKKKNQNFLFGKKKNNNRFLTQ